MEKVERVEGIKIRSENNDYEKEKKIEKISVYRRNEKLLKIKKKKRERDN